ncbi:MULTISPECIES: hypothetical protein [unclassified Bradyrhizobium]|uniref:hypothetical protein n=1 Tax=unclassified Bradyrhizobium TaxID=2631580 RepID=UPI0028E972F1|nr:MULTISPECIES: hypothetical protein [unclassified Bradyrhizobium]
MQRKLIVALAAALVGVSGGTPSTNAQDAGRANCESQLSTFVLKIDNLLAQHPRDLNEVLSVVHRHLPAEGCTADVASKAMKTSAFFKGEERNDHSIQFSLFNGTSAARGAAVLLVLNDSGQWSPPFAIWHPPYP